MYKPHMPTALEGELLGIEFALARIADAGWTDVDLFSYCSSAGNGLNFRCNSDWKLAFVFESVCALLTSLCSVSFFGYLDP